MKRPVATPQRGEGVEAPPEKRARTAETSDELRDLKCEFSRHRSTDGQTDRQTARQTDRQTDRQTNRQTDRQTDRLTD